MLLNLEFGGYDSVEAWSTNVVSCLGIVYACVHDFVCPLQYGEIVDAGPRGADSNDGGYRHC